MNQAYGEPVATLQDSYDKIRLSLVEAVHAIHVPHSQIQEDTFALIRAALLDYDFVYSTNYDLLIYWSLMHDPTGFRDYFFSGSVFDIGNTEVWHKSTKVLFLHGALHLYRGRRGQTIKRTAGYGNILDDFATPIAAAEEEVTPLFITEGTSADKLRSIYTSDYLSFGYSQLSLNSGPMVIFGHSLDEQFDDHLVAAIRTSSTKVLGIGIHPPSDPVAISQIKAKWRAKFYNLDLFFFDSTTHPLGATVLHV